MSPAPLMLSVFSTFAVGGPQVRFAQLVAGLGTSWRHTVIAMDGRLDCRERLPPEADVTYPALSFRKGQMLANAFRFRAALKALKPDLLVTYNWGTIEWAMANALPVVRQVHVEDGFGPEERDRQIPRRVWMRRLFLRRATVVLPSRRLETIARDIWRLPPARLRYIPNGIDLSRFAPRDRSLLPEVPVIGTVAALRPEKNLARLVRAFASVRALRPARLAIVGDGPERLALEALARELGLAEDVVFHGHQPDPAALFSGFDLFALSSDTEQMPISVLEAMAAGLPVAATDVGDVRLMLAQENVPCVVQRDTAALAGAMTRLLLDDALRRDAGAANRGKAEREYDERLMVDAYARVFASPG